MRIQKKMSKLNTYSIDIDIKWSLQFEVKAKNKTEAKNKAFKKITKSDFNFDVEKIENGY